MTHELLNLNVIANVDFSDPQITFILGRPGFDTGPIASVLRLAGYDINRRYEDEQAKVIVWLILMRQKHCENWKSIAEQTLSEIHNSHRLAAAGK